MEYLYIPFTRVVAANASARVSFAPATSTGKWKLIGASIVPNETSAVHATDYVDITMKKGSTALMAAARSTTSSTGTALTQNTGEALSISGTGTDLECTLAAPHHLLIDATPGAGVATDISGVAVYQQLLG